MAGTLRSFVPASFKAATLFALALVVSVLLPPKLKEWAGAGLYEIQAPAWTGLAYLTDLQAYFGNYAQPRVELIEAGRDLARLNAAYELTRVENETLREELARLEAYFEMPSHSEYRYEVARVIRRDVNAWWDRMTIRKGRQHGISEGDAVVYVGGVVGRVETVHLYTSEVILVSDRRFRMAAHLQGDNRPVTYQGKSPEPFSPPVGTASSIQPDVVIPPGEHLDLVSSRLGGVFPDGLPVGRITRLKPSLDGLFQTAEVALNPELLSLWEVAVLVPIDSEVPTLPALPAPK